MMVKPQLREKQDGGKTLCIAATRHVDTMTLIDRALGNRAGH